MTPEEAQRQTLQQQGPRITQPSLSWRDPLRWLQAGWRDLLRCPAVSLSYGVFFTLLVWALGLLFRHRPDYTLMLGSTIPLLGPALAMGLIDASRSCEIGNKPILRLCLVCWWRVRSSVALFSCLLLVIELLWARSSILVFALFTDSMTPTDNALALLLDPHNLGFTAAYMGIGGLFAAIAFGFSAVSVPMMLDRPIDAISAALTSLRCCLERPAVLLLWGLLLAALTLLALLPLGLGLVLAWPLMGHASWHAYRGIVNPEQLAALQSPPEAT